MAKYNIQWGEAAQMNRTNYAGMFPLWANVEEALDWSLSRGPYRYDKIGDTPYRYWRYGPILTAERAAQDVNALFSLDDALTVTIHDLHLSDPTPSPIDLLVRASLG
jgi:hypothetical protein